METIIPDESFGVFYRREYSSALQSGVPCIDGGVGLSSGQIVEIIGPHQSGKTKLLIQVRELTHVLRFDGDLDCCTMYSADELGWTRECCFDD